MSDLDDLCAAEACRARADVYEQIFFACTTEEQKKWLEIREAGFMLGFKSGWVARGRVGPRLVKETANQDLYKNEPKGDHD